MPNEGGSSCTLLFTIIWCKFENFRIILFILTELNIDSDQGPVAPT